MSIRGIPLAAMAFATFVSCVDAEDAAEFFKKVDAAVYQPSEHGLKDVKVEYHDSMWAMNPQLAKLSATLYWKAPNMRKADIQGAEGPMAAMMARNSSRMVGMLVPERNVDKLNNYTFELSTAAGQVMAVGTLKADAAQPDLPKKVAITFDERNLPVKQVIAVPTGGDATVEMTYQEKDGKFLPDTVSMTSATPMGQMTVKMTYHYQQIEGAWLPESVSQEAMGMKGEITFENYQVNKGIDDGVFGDAGKKDDGK